MVSMSKQLPPLYTTLEIEPLAASTALEFALDMGFGQAVLETDSLVLANALINDSPYLSSDGLLIEDIRFQASSFNQLLYSHVKREDNKVAHNFARHTICILDFSM